MAKLIEITGKALSGEWGTDDETGCGIPVLRTTNFTNEGIVNYRNVVTRTITKKKIAEKYLRQGDIIIEKSGGSDKQPVGRVIYFDGPDSTYLFNNFTGLLRVKDRNVWYPRYVFYSLFFNYRRGGTKAFENKTTGLHNLKVDDYVSRCEVRVENIQKQVAICEQLDRIFDIIRARQQQLQKLDELIKARFVEMFGDLVVGNKIKTNRHKIGDIAFVTKLAGFEFTKYVQYKECGDIIMLRGLNCKKGKLVLDDIKWIDKATSDLLPRSKLYYGDILMTYAGTIGDVAMVDADDKYHLAPNVAKITLKEEAYNPIFLMHLFLYTNNYIMTFASKVAQASINMGKIRNLEYFFPDIDMQNWFATFVEQVDKSKVVVQDEVNGL